MQKIRFVVLGIFLATGCVTVEIVDVPDECRDAGTATAGTTKNFDGGMP